MPSPTTARAVMRSAARYMTEPHPFARNPSSMTPHAVPWKPYVQHFTRAGQVYFPTMVFVLGWPLGAAWIVDKIGL